MIIYSSNLVGKSCLIYDVTDLDRLMGLYEEELSHLGRWFADKVRGLLTLKETKDIVLKQINCEIVFDNGVVQVKLPSGELYNVPEWQKVYIIDE